MTRIVAGIFLWGYVLGISTSLILRSQGLATISERLWLAEAQFPVLIWIGAVDTVLLCLLCRRWWFALPTGLMSYHLFLSQL